MKVIDIFKISILLLILASTAISCSEATEEVGTNTTPSTGGGVGSTPVGTVDATGLWVDLVSKEFPTYVHQVGDFSKQCVITTDASKGQVLNCVVDIMEGDLYLYDLEVQYNAAPNLCENVVVQPAWHWNESSGIGPSEVTIDVDATGSPYIVTACTAKNHSGVTTACSLNPELSDIANTSGPTCVYNHSKTLGNNCCFGEYTLTINTTTGAGTSGSTSVKSWGDSVEKCIGGMVQSGWDEKTKDGYPWPLISPVKEATEDGEEGNGGLNKSIKLSSNASTTATGFSTFANWYETTGTPHNHNGYVVVTSTNQPYAVNPVDDLDGTPYVAPFIFAASNSIRYGSDTFTVICQDEGNEEIHRINLFIREWNTFLDFDAYGKSGGATADYKPDVTGTEGVHCNTDGPVGGSCNDIYDLDDLVSGAGYDTVTVDAAIRKSYFPGVKY